MWVLRLFTVKPIRVRKRGLRGRNLQSFIRLMFTIASL